MECTWLDCQSEATVPQIRKDGSRWANLCGQHDRELNQAVSDSDARNLLYGWVKALGAQGMP
jgi:hypothetical protein